ncbi:MAG: hypothetical protein AB9903_36460 [Vulcanimicrobiota bacterium]
MAHVKTALSIEKSLFDRVELLAHSMKVPRSRIMSLALKDYLDRLEQDQILERINAACEDMPDEFEKRWLQATAYSHAERIKDE